MNSPAEYNFVLHAGGICSFFGKFSCLVRCVFHKVVQRLFVFQRFAVLFYDRAVVYLFGKGRRGVIFKIFLDQLLCFGLCIKVQSHKFSPSMNASAARMIPVETPRL